MRVADLGLLAAVIALAIGRTFTPALTISAVAVKRRYRAPLLWAEVVDVLPPSRLGKGMRLRLNDRRSHRTSLVGRRTRRRPQRGGRTPAAPVAAPRSAR